MRVFLDANVLFSAAKSDGAVRRLLALLVKRRHRLCVDPYVVEEARRNLAAKFPVGVALLEELLPGMESVATIARSEDGRNHGLPDKDRPVMAAAISGRCQVLLTGDKTHFGPLYGREVEGVQVLSPAMLAAKVLASSPRRAG